MRPWLNLSSASARLPHAHALQEHVLLEVLRAPVARTSVFDQPTIEAVQAVLDAGCELALATGPHLLNPQLCPLWDWAASLQPHIQTTAVGAAGLTNKEARNPKVGSCPLYVVAQDRQTVQSLNQEVGPSALLAGSPALMTGQLCGEVAVHPALVIGLTAELTDEEVAWLEQVIKNFNQPVHVLVHGDNTEWMHAAKLAASAPSAVIRDVQTFKHISDWAQVLRGSACMAYHIDEAVAAASMGVPTLKLDLQASTAAELTAAGAAHLSTVVPVSEDGQTVDPQEAIDGLGCPSQETVFAGIRDLLSLLETLGFTHLPDPS